MGISCYLLGEDSLLIQCANILLKYECDVHGVISPLNSVKDWAKINKVVCFDNLDQFLSSNPSTADYIFSIVNNYILTEEVTRIARKGVINYHDSLLPKYAGLNSTTWAIINSEQEHGVTWHMATSKIDAGDILKQFKVAIHDNDSVFSLNLRCYEKAIFSFDELINDILKDKLLLIKQNLNDRSYYGSGYPLPNFGFIDWDNAFIDTLSKLSRALSFNHYDNNVGSMKIHIKDDYVIPFEIETFFQKNKKYDAGNILNISDDMIDVSVNDGVLRIKSFLSKQGNIESVKNVVDSCGLKRGNCFLNLQHSSIKKISNIYSEVLKREPYWLNQFKQTNEHILFLNGFDPKLNISFQEIETSISLSRLSNFKPNKIEKFVLSTILAYLFRLNNYNKFSIVFVHKEHQKLSKSHANLFSIFLPLVTDWSPRISLNGILRNINKQMRLLKKENTFFTDIFCRHPSIQTTSLDLNILVNLSGKEVSKIPENTTLIFNYLKKTNEIRISHKFDVGKKNSEFRELVNNMADHIINVLNKFMDNPYVSISEFCFLNSTERDLLLNELGQGEKRIYSETSIISLFQQQVKSHPNYPAILEKNKSTTYQELWDISEKVLVFIQLKKIKPRSLIGIYTERSVEMLAIILGILRAHCVYVPLDTRYPMIKIETISHASDLISIICSYKLYSKLTNHFSEKQTIGIYSTKDIFKNASKIKRQSPQKKPEKLAYIMFTSGTTGDPKGVMVTQTNVINYCLWFTETTKFKSDSSIDFSSSIAFDLSVPCIIAPLLVGGKVVICDEATKTNPKSYLEYLIKHKISHVELTPGYLEMLLGYPDLISKLKNLKVLLLGADVLPINDVVKWSKIYPGHQIVNEYGPTEATVSATSYFIGNNIENYNFSVPIGKPGYNTSCYILDAYENLCPIGMKGELHIGGAQITNGYLGKPLLSKEKFISFTLREYQEIIYKTGDLVSWLPCGNLQFYGRNDFQVKIQGYRVELSGIESVLLKMPQILQAVVLPKNGHYKDKYLSAYLVVSDSHTSAREIKSFLLSYLPSYMIPREFYVVDRIPLKQNEKIDFVALEQQTNTMLSYEYAIPNSMNDYEIFVSRVWQEAFHNNQITIFDNFFDVGGNSFIALHIISELKRYYKIDIPLSDLFEYPSIESLAKKIEELCSSGDILNKKTRPSSIVKLSEDDSNGIPLFLIHPVGGSVFWYKKLAMELKDKYTVYGIQDVTIENVDQYFSSLEAMAEYYLNQIDELNFGDGYCIGGASFGATVAFEMAHQILKRNKKIDFLGIFDGWAIYPDELMRSNNGDKLQHRDNTQKIGRENLDFLNGLEKYRQKLLLQYRIPTLNINMHLFKASELWDVFVPIDDLYNGWKSFVLGEIKTHKVPGNHETMFFDKNAGFLAECIKRLA